MFVGKVVIDYIDLEVDFEDGILEDIEDFGGLLMLVGVEFEYEVFFVYGKVYEVFGKG